MKDRQSVVENQERDTQRDERDERDERDDRDERDQREYDERTISSESLASSARQCIEPTSGSARRLKSRGSAGDQKLKVLIFFSANAYSQAIVVQFFPFFLSRSVPFRCLFKPTPAIHIS